MLIYCIDVVIYFTFQGLYLIIQQFHILINAGPTLIMHMYKSNDKAWLINLPTLTTATVFPSINFFNSTYITSTPYPLLNPRIRIPKHQTLTFPPFTLHQHITYLNHIAIMDICLFMKHKYFICFSECKAVVRGWNSLCILVGGSAGVVLVFIMRLFRMCTTLLGVCDAIIAILCVNMGTDYFVAVD